MAKRDVFDGWKYCITCAIAAAFLLLLSISAAYADCPTTTMGLKPEGHRFYNPDLKYLQYCDGTNWIAMHGEGSGSGGCPMLTRPGLKPEGYIFYNKDHRYIQACAGNVWMAMGPDGGLGGPYSGACTDPDRPEGRLVYNSRYDVYQYCDGANWVLVGKILDNAPDAFAFTDETGVALFTLIESNIVEIAGIISASLSIAGDGGPEYRICDDAPCSSVDHDWASGTGSIDDGQFLQLRLTSNAAFSTMNSATVTVGTASDQWDVTTEGQDITPDAFSFTDQTGVALSTQISSNTINITGITGSVPLSISGSGSPEFRVDGGSWVTSGSITNGQSLQLRLTGSASFDTMRSATVTVGTESDQWDVTTVAQDTTPDAFNFTDQTDVAVSTVIESNIGTITGITGDVSVSISGDGSPEFSIDGGGWTTSGTITNGQTLQLRLTSNSAGETMNNATVTVGTESDQWDVTTRYHANAVYFDGSSDYLTRGAGLTGAADSKLLTVSFWFRSPADGVGFGRVISMEGPVVPHNRIHTSSSNDIRIVGRSPTSTVLDVTSSADSILVADGWQNILFSCDLSDPANRHLYIQDVSDLATVTAYTDDDIDFTGTEWGVGARSTATNFLHGDVADLMVWFGTYVDLSVEANRRMFISTSGRPVNPDASGGAISTLGEPNIRLTNPTATWHTNDGTGGGFTENGVLTDAATSPSD